MQAYLEFILEIPSSRPYKAAEVETHKRYHHRENEWVLVQVVKGRVLGIKCIHGNREA